jgi:formate-dependent phosphoribosylglycinamide formyltransferase (GAR transformylase)
MQCQKLSSAWQAHVEGTNVRSRCVVVEEVITYELLGLVIKRSNDIVSLFKVLENIRIDA